MTGSELIEKILKKEIKSGTHIKCHAGFTVRYTIDLWFVGNWFTKENPFKTNCPEHYNDIILYLCNENATFEIIEDKKIEKLDILKQQVTIANHYSKDNIQCIVNEFYRRYSVLINKINAIIEVLNEKEKIQDNQE